jgi:3-phenylpropionate/trans-cinnamate dioxygenase ferredoxin reductase component
MTLFVNVAVQSRRRPREGYTTLRDSASTARIGVTAGLNTPMPQRLVIVGAGQAAASAIAAISKSGASLDIDLVGEEAHLPYQRPPLSKKFLAGSLQSEHLWLRPESYYAQHGVRMHQGTRAVAIDRANRTVALSNGKALAYDALLLALGATPRALPIPGADLPGICFLRSISDVATIRAGCAPGRRAVVVGGGYIGLEVAATLRGLGLEVTVLETMDRLMQRVVCEEVSRFYRAEHERHGVRVVLNARVDAFVGDTAVRGVRCANGDVYPADLVVVGVGVAPITSLAADARLEVGNGIVVDAHGRTSDPEILAAGDCTCAPRARYSGLIRLESVDNAIEQANTAIATLLNAPAPKEHVPWFWSDQYETKLVIVGLAQGYDRIVIRGNPAEGAFSACYLRGRELIAIETISSPKDQMAARQLIAARAELDPAKIVDRAIALRDCA